MSFRFPFLPNLLKGRSRSVLEAEEKIRQIAESGALEPKSKMAALAIIRQDFMHIRSQHAEIASLPGHPGWERLKSILQRDVTGKLANWRVMLRSDPNGLDALESWCQAAEYIMGIVESEAKQYDRATQLLQMSDVELVEHVVGVPDDESKDKGD